jgi:hypothetical protein
MTVYWTRHWKFLVVAFIALMGFDFLHASANAKMVNLATNFGSICLFVLKGKIIWAILAYGC